MPQIQKYIFSWKGCAAAELFMSVFLNSVLLVIFIEEYYVRDVNGAINFYLAHQVSTKALIITFKAFYSNLALFHECLFNVFKC